MEKQMGVEGMQRWGTDINVLQRHGSCKLGLMPRSDTALLQCSQIYPGQKSNPRADSHLTPAPRASPQAGQNDNAGLNTIQQSLPRATKLDTDQQGTRSCETSCPPAKLQDYF